MYAAVAAATVAAAAAADAAATTAVLTQINLMLLPKLTSLPISKEFFHELLSDDELFHTLPPLFIQ